MGKIRAELKFYTMEDGQKIYHTAVPVKAKYWSMFAELIENQFRHGGAKYSIMGRNDKEYTDLVCEASPGKTGVDWVMQTIIKYTGRFLSFQREKDLLKMATFCYIAWLKKGYMLRGEHDEDTKAAGKPTYEEKQNFNVSGMLGEIQDYNADDLKIGGTD